jgi:4-amino-4-deoxy-L-arabinose transferase-like glycosyltransferase
MRAPTSHWPHLNFESLLLGLWFVFLLVVNIFWHAIDCRSPGWDESIYLWFSQRAFQLIQELKIVEALRSGGISYPNFVPLVTALSYFVLGDDPTVAILFLNMVSILIIFVSIFWLGQLLYDRTTGLLGCIVFSCYPGVMLWSKYYLMDLPLAAAVSFTILCAVQISRTNYKNRRWISLLAVSIGVGMCVKHLFSAFVLTPLAWLLINSLLKSNHIPEQTFASRRFFYLTFLSGIAAGLAYHVLNYQTFKELFMRSLVVHNTTLAKLHSPNPLESLSRFYEFCFGNSPFFLALLVIGLVASLWQLTKTSILVYAAIIGIFVVLLYVTHFTNGYYFLPALPMVALVSCTWCFGSRLSGVSKSRIWIVGKRVLTISVGLFFFAQFLRQNLGTANILNVVSRSSQLIVANEKVPTDPFVQSWWTSRTFDGNSSLLPYSQYWPVKEMVSQIREQIDVEGSLLLPPLKIAVLSNHESMTPHYFNYLIWRQRLNQSCSLVYPLPFPKGVLSLDYLKDYDFLILKSGRIFHKDVGIESWMTETEALLNRLLLQNAKGIQQNGFQVLRDFSLPDGSAAFVCFNRAKLSEIHLLSRLGSAKVTAADPRYVTLDAFEINGEQRNVLFEHPSPHSAVTNVRWDNIKIRPGQSLAFGIGLRSTVFSPEHGDGVEFEVDVVTSETSFRIFKRYIDPKNDPTDRRWLDFCIPLEQFAGREVSLVFCTSPGTNGNYYYDHAGWSDPMIR